MFQNRDKGDKRKKSIITNKPDVPGMCWYSCSKIF